MSGRDETSATDETNTDNNSRTNTDAGQGVPASRLDGPGGFVMILNAAFSGEQSIGSVWGAGKKACPAWAYLELVAIGGRSFREHDIRLSGGRKVRLGPYQFLGTRSYFAERWNWPESNVRNFLERLVENGDLRIAAGQTTKEKRKCGTIYELAEARQFLQKPSTEDGAADNATANTSDRLGDAREDSKTEIQNDGKTLSGETGTVVSDRERQDRWLEIAKAVYPRRKHGRDAEARAALEEMWDEVPPPEEAAKAIEWQLYCGKWTESGGQYIPKLANWILQRGWLEAGRLSTLQQDWHASNAENWLVEVCSMVPTWRADAERMLPFIRDLPHDALPSPQKVYAMCRSHDSFAKMGSLPDFITDVVNSRHGEPC